MSRRLVSLLLLAFLLLPSAETRSVAQEAPNSGPESFRSSPVMFIENVGQFAEGARFQAWGEPAGMMWLAEDAIWLTVVEVGPEETAAALADPQARFDPRLAQIERENTPWRVANIKLSFVGANAHPRLEPFDRLDTKVSYFIGNDPNGWRPEVPVWGGVRYVDVYPGVDLELTSEDGQIVQRLAARPGADPNMVQLRIEGANNVMADRNVLRLNTAASETTLSLLRSDRLHVATVQVQKLGSRAFDVTARFAAESPSAHSSLATPLSPADNPTDLFYSTFLGGSGDEVGGAIAVDEAGNAYVTGNVYSRDFPTTPGAFDRSPGANDVFVVKLNQTGGALAYATFLGGSTGSDDGYDIVADSAGNAYVTGETGSRDFPTTPGAFNTTNPGGFITKLNSTGSGLTYSTFVGNIFHPDLAVDALGCAYIAGSGSIPATPGAFDTTYNGSGDVVVAKVNPFGSGLIYATYLGGSDADIRAHLAVDEAGSAYVTGQTSSADFPTTPGAFDTSYNYGNCGSYRCPDAFVVKLNSSGSGLTYATFLGGANVDGGGDIAVSESGGAYVIGRTVSGDFPVTPGAFDTNYNGGTDVFIVKLNATGSALAYATYLGGSQDDEFSGGNYSSGRSYGIAVDRTGSAFVAGNTVSWDFPTTAEAFDRVFNGGRFGDAFVAKLSPTGSELNYATFLGGSYNDWGMGIALDKLGRAYVTGGTDSTDFPTTPTSFDTSCNCPTHYLDTGDVFVAKLAVGNPPIRSVAGRVAHADGTAVSDVSISNGMGDSTVTDASGNYAFSGLSAGTYTLTATKPGYLFVPPSVTVDLRANQSGVDFTAVPYSSISVNRIEATQVFLDHKVGTTDEIPLIAGKQTMVRVYVKVNGNTPVAGMTARLHIRDAAGQDHFVSTVINGSVTATANPDRMRLSDTINFLPQTVWLRGTVSLSAEALHGTQVIANSPVYTVTFQPAKELRIGIVPIKYRGQQVSLSKITGIESWAEWTYPTSAIAIEVLPELQYDGELDCDEPISNRLVERWIDWSSGITKLDFVYGLLPPGALNGGLACGGRDAQGQLSKGVVAFGDAWTSYQQRTQLFAHESAHLLGRGHTKAGVPWTCGNPTPSMWSDWPAYFGNAGIQVWGLDWPTNQSLDPAHTVDYMSYCWGRSDIPFYGSGKVAWVSPWTYTKMFQESLDPGTMAATGNPSDASYFRISGVVQLEGSATLGPIWRDADNLASSLNPRAGSNYCVNARRENGTSAFSYCFDLDFVDPHSGESTNSRAFNLVIPDPGNVSEIVLSKAANQLTSRQVSHNHPDITVTTPNGGETWLANGTQTIRWAASDIDGDVLTYNVLYSPDGTNWVPVATSIQETQVNIDLAELGGGSAAKVRVEVTDGVNTASDESDGTFSVAPKAPWTVILAPETGTVIPAGHAVLLQGDALSLEEGTLPDTAYRWSSSRDGNLGTGTDVVAALSPGEHAITLTVTGGSGLSASAAVEVFVGAKAYLPLMRK